MKKIYSENSTLLSSIRILDHQKHKFYHFVLTVILLLFNFSWSYGQNSEYQYVQNFESWPDEWGVFNRNNPGPTNYTWFKSNNTSLGKAYNGEYTSYIITGITSEVNDGDNISQWVYTNTFPISNGDVISFYTKSLYGVNGSDRLQVRLATSKNVYVENSPSATGNFNVLLKEINPTHNDGYPNEWTKYTATISSLAEGEVVMGRIGFRYYVPNVGCSGCSASTGTGLPENSIGLDEEEMYYLELGYTTAETLADLSDGASAGSFLLWSAFQYGVSLADLVMNSYDASMVGIDNFVYNPVDIKLKNHNGDYFVHSNNPTFVAADFYKDMCVNNDVLGQNVLKFTIDNKGQSFNITSAEITGSGASSFKFWLPEAQIATTHPSGAAAQRPTDFYMKFDPATSGSKEAIVVFNTNQPSFPQIKFKITGSTNGSSGPATLVARTNINLNINDGGTYQIPATLSYVDVQKYIALEYSSYECDYTNMTWTVVGGAKTFTASNVGTSPTFTIQGYDSRYGFTSICAVTVNIIDKTPPVITTPGYTFPDETYYLHPDSSVFYKKNLRQPTVTFQDNSGSIVGVPHWDSDIIGGHGTYGLTWHFEDQFGNKAFKIFNQTIHVVDNTPPVAIAKDVEISYNFDKATVKATDVNNGSYDNSSKDLLLGFWVDASAVPAYGVTNDSRLKESISFNCSDAGTTQLLKFVVKDLKTNQQSWVTVNVPIAEIGPGICKNTTVYLNGRPTASITPNQVYKGSGSCYPTEIFLSKSTFSCDDIDFPNFVDVTIVSDNSTNTCVSKVTVLDYPIEDPNIYNSSYGESTINKTIEDPLHTYETVTVYRPYELACNDSAEWTYRSTGSTVIEETTVNMYSTNVHFYPGTSFLRIKQVHPTLKNMYGKPLTTEIQKTITIKDTTPLLVTFAYDIPAFIYDNSCSTTVNIRCPWGTYFADRDKVVGKWGYELTGATERLVTDRLIGPEESIDDEINFGITNIKFFGYDIGGNILDTLRRTITVERANTTPKIECQHYTVPDEFPNPYTFTIKDPIQTFCEVDNTVTWDVKILNAYKTYTWFEATGLKDEQTVEATLNGADKAYNGYYYMETVIRQNGQAKGACYTQVNLYDRYAPEITCPDTTIVQLDQANCALNYSVSRPLVVNNPQNNWQFSISGDKNYTSPVMSYATASANVTLEVGEYTLTLFGKDVFGHVSSCSTQIIVQDVIAPDVTCPGNVTLSKAIENCETAIGTCNTTNNFTGDYAPNRIEKIAINSLGKIDFSQTPGSITIKDGNNNSEVVGNILVRFRMACDGTMNFAWNYTPNTVDNSYFVNKPFYRVLGDKKKNLTGFDETSEAASQSGSVSFEVNKGDIVEIGITEANNGVSGATLKISSFSAPGFTPSIAFPEINESCNYTFTSNIESAYSAGVHTVNYKVVDDHGNTSTCKQTITVNDNNPVSATAQDATFYLNEDGEVTINAKDLFTSCLPYTSSLSKSNFTKDDLGENLITLTAFNTAGDSAKTTSTVTIADTLKPFIKYDVLDFVINPSITDTLTLSDLLPIAGDNCFVDTIYTSKSTFDCSELGKNAVDFILVDVSGNRDTISGWVNVIPDGFSVDNEIGEQKLCSGDTALFTVSATNVSSYQWQQEKTNPEWESWGTNKMLTHSYYNLGYPYNRSKMVLNRFPAASWLNHEFYVMYQVGSKYGVQKVEYYWQDSSYRWEQQVLYGTEASIFNPYTMAVSNYEPFDMDVSPLGIGVAAISSTGAANIVVENFGSYVTLTGPIGSVKNIEIGFGYADLFVATTSTYVSQPAKSNRISVHKYDRSNVQWIDIGPEAFGPRITAMNMGFDSDYYSLPFLAFVSESGKLSVMKATAVGSSAEWEYVGNAEFANATASHNSQIKLAFKNKVPYVAYIDPDHGGKVTVKKFNGNQWETVGIAGFSELAYDDISLTFQGDVPYVSYSVKDNSNPSAVQNNTHIYRFVNGIWKPLNSPMVAINTNTNNTQAFSSIEIVGEEIFMYTQDSTLGELSVLNLWEDIPGATSDTLIIPHITKAMDGKQVRCLYGTGCANKLTDPGFIYVDSISAITAVTGDKYMNEAPGVLHLSATANYGTVEWFDADGVTSLGKGNNYTTPALFATQNFYVKAVDGSCASNATVSVLAEIPFTAHNSYADTICKNEQAILYIEGQQEGHKYDVYTDDVNGTDSLVMSWVSDGWPNYPRIQNMQKTTEFRIKNSTYYKDALGLLEYNDYVEFGNIDDVNVPVTGAITVEAWINKPSSGNGFPWLSYSNPDDADMSQTAYVWNNGTFEVNKAGTWYTLDFPTLPVGWTHVVTVASNSEMKIYYNGTLVASSTNITNDPINTPSNPSLIVGRDGRYPSSYSWTNSQVSFDNLRVWNEDVYKWNYNLQSFMDYCIQGDESRLVFACDFDNIIGDTSVISKKGPNGIWYAQNKRYGKIEGRGTCITVDSIMMDTVTVFVRNYEGIGNYTDYFEGCSGSQIALTPGIGNDSLMWFDAPDPNFAQLLGYGDTLLVELEPDEEAEYFISSSPECKSQPVYAYATEIPALESITAETLCGTGYYVSDIYFDWSGNDGVDDVLYWDAPVGGNLIYGRYENGYWDYPEEGEGGGEGEGEGGSPVFVGTILEGSDPEVTGIDTLYAEAYNDYCFAAERIPVIINMSPEPEIISTTDGIICAPGEVTVSAEGIGGYIEWYDNGRSELLGTGDSYTTTITETTGFYAYVYSEACSDWSYEVYAEGRINASSTGDTTDVVSCGNYRWNNTLYTESGIYSQTLVNAGGCDSVAAINLTILENVGSDTTVYGCGGFEWRGKTINTSGVYRDTLSSVTGCDSVLRLVYINRTSYTNIAEVACNSFDWYGTTYTESGQYTHTLTNKFACDSIVTLNLTIQQPTVGSTSAVSCSSYSWYGTTYTASGNYTHTLQNAFGCDSIVTLNLTIEQPESIDTTVVACDSYTWYGQTYTQSGNYVENISSGGGCGQEVTMHLTINQATSGDTIAVACESFTWYGTEYLVSGNYTHTLQTKEGCDSVITLNLTFIEPSTSETTITACTGYEWFGTTYMSSGDYTHTVANYAGCDSTITLHLTINQPSTGDTTVTACNNFNWYGTTYSASGNYYHTLQTVSGCDSLVTLKLTIVEPSTSETTVSACSNYEWFGTTYMSSGDFTHTLANYAGCDSTITLHLTINQPLTSDTTVTACNSFNWYGTTYSTSGNYYHTLQTVSGCDSIVTLKLTIVEPSSSETTVTACTGYEWFGTTYMSSGDYTHTLANYAGCDSTITLHLTINQPLTSDTTVTACNSFNWYGTTYSTSGNYYHTLQTVSGCDSILTLKLTIVEPSTSETTVTACTGYEWFGTTYMSSGDYTHTLANYAGCDSIITLHLTINQPSAGDTTVTACSSFNWYGTTYSTSGNYNHTLQTVTGCDSLVTLKLSIVEPSTSETTVSACSNYEWFGTTYMSSGDFTHTLANYAGCDSTITLHLTINQAFTIDTTVVACNSFDWYGTTYSSSGNYTHTTQTVSGCDSVVTLNLTIEQPGPRDTTVVTCDSFVWYGQTYTQSGNFVKNIVSEGGCDQEVTMYLTINQSSSGDTTAVACENFNWYGTEYLVSGNYTQTLQTVSGCDSVVTLNLTINQAMVSDTSAVACESFEWYGTSYTESGSYSHNLHTVAGCDSVITLQLTINQLVTNTLSVAICEGDTYALGNQTLTVSGQYTEVFSSVNGCDSTVIVNLTVNPTLNTSETQTICSGSSYTFGNLTLTQAGTYTETFASVTGCDSVVTLTLVVDSLPGKPGIPTGNQVVDNSTGSTEYSVSALENAESYNWLLLPAESGTISGSGTTATVSWSTSYTGDAKILVQGVNHCGDGPYSETLKISVVSQPSADFSYTVNGLEVSFTNLSSNTNGYNWDFGDGYYSDQAHVVHTYKASGYYTVCLKASNTNSGKTNEKCLEITVGDVSEVCKADFSYQINLGEVSFTNTSTEGYTDILWDFGDGNYSTQDQTVHQYSSSGYYAVALTVYNATTDCMDETVKTLEVKLDETPVCNAEFSYYGTLSDVTFSNESAGNPTVYFWDFGDGSYSTDENPEHHFESSGYFDVSLTIYNDATGCMDNVTNSVYVYNPDVVSCNAQYTYIPDGLQVTFTSQALGNYSQYFWDFDNGKNSNLENPVHVFEESGFYNVSFTVIDTLNNCFDTRTKVIYVHDNSGTINYSISANFDYLPDNSTNKVLFTDKTLGTVSNWYWDFGDNSPASTSKNPEYTYSINDYYHVCLTAGNVEKQSTNCKFIAVGDVTNSSTAYYTYFADSVSSTAYFKNKSLGNIVSYMWDFGDGLTSTQKNPTHAYADTGYYAVCLSTVSASGVTKTYCNDVRIGNAVANPCLYSCVWPGDANNDLEANHYDIMTIGLNYGLEGPKRENASIGWYGQFAQNWSTYQTNGTNNKHGDCNGDGIINDLDTLAIYQNFAFSHYQQPDFKGAEWQIYCQWLNDGNINSNGMAMADIILETNDENTNAEIYGIGFEIEMLNAEGINWDNVSLSFEDSWLGVAGDDLLTFYEVNSDKHTIYVAAVRKDHQNISGVGAIARVYFAVDNSETINNLSFNVTTSGGIKSDGNTVPVGGSILLNLGSDITLCQGDVATILAPEGFETYIWNTGSTLNSIEVTETGMYVLQIIDSLGYSTSDTLFVNVVPNPEPELGQDITENGVVTLDAGEGFTSYLWNTGETTQTITVEQTGTYWVKVQNEWGCEGADTIGVVITGINNVIALTSLSLYPNPSTGNFWIISQANINGKIAFEMFDPQGNKIMYETINVDGKLKHLVTTNQLSQGIYLVRIQYQNESKNIRLVVQ